MAEDFSEVVKTQKEQLAATKKASGLSQKRLERAAELTELIDAQNQKMEEQKNLLEKQGIDTKSNKKFQAEELKLAKLEKSRAKATGSADAEDAAKQKIADQKGNTFLGKIAGGIGGLLKSGKEKVKSGASSLFSMLKNFAIGGLAIAAMAFLNSPYFDKMVKIIKEDIIPALAILIDDYIIPIGKLIWDGIVKQWETIKKLFSGLKESFALFGEGKWMEGICVFFSSIGTYLLETMDTLGTLLFNTIATIFGFEKTDSVGGSLKKFFTDIYDKLAKSISETWTSFKKFFTVTIPIKIKEALAVLSKVGDKLGGIFSDLWAKVEEKVGNFAIFKLIDQVFGDLFSSIKCIFAGDFSMKNLLKGGGALLDIAFAGLNLAVNAIKDIFCWGDPDKPFRLSTFIGEVFEKVVTWFKKLLDFDFSSIIKSIPGAKTVMKFFESDKTPNIGQDRAGDVPKKIADEIARKDRVDDAQKRGGLFRPIDKSIEKQEKFLAIAVRKKNEENINKIRLRIEELKRQRAEKSNAGSTNVNTSTVDARRNTHFSTNVTSLINTDSVTNALSAAADG